MNHLNNKKILIFLTVPHHFRRLFPIRSLLNGHGAETTLMTSFPFPSRDSYLASHEKGLIDLKEPYEHVYDYIDNGIRKRIDDDSALLFEQSKDCFDDVTHPFFYFSEDKIGEALYETIEHYHLFCAMLEQKKPDLVVVLHEGLFWVKILVAVAHAKKIPAISFQEGLWYEDDLFFQSVYRRMADFSKLFAWGQQAYDIARKTGASLQNIELLGNIEFEKMTPGCVSQKEIDHMKKKWNVQSGEKIVGLLPASLRDLDQFDLNKSIQFLWDNLLLENPTYVLVVKPHPLDNSFMMDERFQNNSRIVFEKEAPPLHVIASCHALIPVDSTIGIEALLLGKAVFELHYPGMRYRHGMAYHKGAESIRGPDDIQKIKNVCEGKASSRHAKRREHYLDWVLRNRGTTVRDEFISKVIEVLHTEA